MMETILHEYNLTRDLFDLEIEIKIDSEVYFRGKADSLTENFLTLLYHMMGNKRLHGVKDIHQTRMDQTVQAIPFNSGYGKPILSITTSDPRTVILSALIVAGAIGDGVQLSGIRTPALMNGPWTIESVADGNKNLTLSGASLSVVGTSAYVSGDTPSYIIAFLPDANDANDGFPDSQTWSRPWICVGARSSPASKLDWAMNDFIIDGSSTGQLDHSSMIVAVPAVAGNTSTIAVTRDFTNNSGATITVKEVGLFSGGWADSAYSADLAMLLIARDLSTFTILNGSTIEVSYRFNTSSVASGGFLRQFGELFYRQLAQLSREAKDIFNANQIDNQSAEQFRLAVGGGSSYLDTTPSIILNSPMQYSGVQVGLSSTPVAFADFALSSKVQHGNAINQLFHYGTIVDNWLSNTTNNQFDISALFENVSGATVAVLETGLATDNDQFDTKHMLARHALAAVVYVPDGQCLKVIYRLSV